jgi:ubiquinone/menaquinone biosynthesis C-methylase UbiE
MAEGSSSDDRFARTAERIAARQDERAAELARQVRTFVRPNGDERALDVGTGAGAFALALAPLVREVVGVDLVPELLALARERAAGLDNVEFVEADGSALPFPDFSFDLAGTLRTLHHVHRPELFVAELARVTRPRGHVLVVDQLAPADPLEALELDRFERARDPAHERLLPDGDLRQLFEANRLALLRDRRVSERRFLDDYLELAGCEGEARSVARGLAPHGPETVTATLGWYLLERR